MIMHIINLEFMWKIASIIIDLTYKFTSSLVFSVYNPLITALIGKVPNYRVQILRSISQIQHHDSTKNKKKLKSGTYKTFSPRNTIPLSKNIKEISDEQNLCSPVIIYLSHRLSEIL